jgi:hypothetical protein
MNALPTPHGAATAHQAFETVEALEDFMTEPSPELIADLANAPGDILILGVAGKMGPTLARLAKRAAPSGGSSALLASQALPPAPPWRRRASRPSPAISSTGMRLPPCRRYQTSCSWPA